MASLSTQRTATRVAFGLMIASIALVVLAGAAWAFGILAWVGSYERQDYGDASGDRIVAIAKILFVAGAVLAPIAGMATAALWSPDGDRSDA